MFGESCRMIRRLFFFITVFYIVLLFIFQRIRESFPMTEQFSVTPDFRTAEYRTTHPKREINQQLISSSLVYKGTCSWQRRKKVNCSKIIAGDLEYISEVKSMKVVPESVTCRLQQLVQNCSEFLSAHGYNQLPVTPEERLYPLAFTIKMHKSPEQAETLLRNIYRRHNVYCIYVDKKSPAHVFNTMKRITSCLENVILITERENVVYSSVVHVRSELACMKEVSKSKVKWRYYINMAGQEFPLRTNLEMVKILKSIEGLSDIETYDHPIFLKWRLKSRFLITGNSLAQFESKPSFNYNLNISKGSAYGLFTREFVNFILTDDIAQSFINWLNDTYSPEENVWATLITLPWAPGGYYVEARHLLDTFMSRTIIWSSDASRCYGQYVRSVCVYDLGDLKWLTGRPQFIANKFDLEISDASVLECLEEWYRDKAFHPEIQTIQWNYYRNLPHVLYYKSLNPADKSDTKRAAIKRAWREKHSLN